jgi:hypothetical protein
VPWLPAGRQPERAGLVAGGEEPRPFVVRIRDHGRRRERHLAEDRLGGHVVVLCQERADRLHDVVAGAIAQVIRMLAEVAA